MSIYNDEFYSDPKTLVLFSSKMPEGSTDYGSIISGFLALLRHRSTNVEKM
jgi:hypothetical protein